MFEDWVILNTKDINTRVLNLECNDRPTEDDLDKGWTCQSYVDRGFDMVEYCSKQEWIDGKICGQTCSSYGIKTDLSCVMGN